MPLPKKSTKTRLIKAALDLFAERGVTETTTKAVAERAQVNEVTLFRHFGNKHGLLLAVMEDSAVFAKLGQALLEQADPKVSVSQALKDYAEISLQALDRVPKLVRSVVGEAGQYPLENRLALGQGLTQANNHVAKHLAEVIAGVGWQSRFPTEKLASFLNSLLLGYFIIKSTSEGDELWEGQDDFLESLVELFLHGAIEPPMETNAIPRKKIVLDQVVDLPANLVRDILQRAKKLGRQDYALAYLLFGAGLSVKEIVNLKRSHLITEHNQHLLQIDSDTKRQVLLNKWIMGFRYGSSSSNPATQWLKSRKDNQPEMFITQEEKSMSEQELLASWQVLTEGFVLPNGQTPTIEQARQTWCVEMLMKGIKLEDLGILSGLAVEELQPYAQRAREKLAIEQAGLLDQKKSKSS
ncbi:transcriptional regulator [Xenococcus sp. PCC 7305]|uniref:TetR/AcrR family transcriptional regulator n=1 Tax=Xenococcus sp. PCC 7305 TaxID=102125 RepID=UPI0002AC63D6|nr:TetR/AcrR family transcriptional regulator [Xenococcus sp. PCC 7305]ELS03281.1 transcriptional regulator [Xenococcus sp. PCC 7305]